MKAKRLKITPLNRHVICIAMKAQRRRSARARALAGLVEDLRTGFANGSCGIETIAAGFRMSFLPDEWVIGCACAKCRRLCAILRDAADGLGPISAPIKGRFLFRCAHCTADNDFHSAEFRRFRFGGARRNLAAPPLASNGPRRVVTSNGPPRSSLSRAS
jgi:hypothetical protein